MSKYPIREEDNHFYEDDYHDMHADDLDGKVLTLYAVLGVCVVYGIIRLLMIYG
jgi:hypothetical protein